MKKPSNPVTEAVANHSAERSGEKNLEKTVFPEKFAVRHRTRQKQGNVAFDGAERENRVDAVIGDKLCKVFHK